MMRFLPSARIALALFSLAVASLNAQQTNPRRQALVRGPIDEQVRVTLVGNTRPEAVAVNDLGAVEDGLPMEHMQLLLRRSIETQAAYDAYTESVTDKASPNFHHWLTAAEIGRRFGPAGQDVEAVSGWLALHGFRVNPADPTGMTLDFSGTAGEVREAFGAEIRGYEVNGARHIANSSDPRIPAALLPAVEGVVSLHDFRPHALARRRPEYTPSGSPLRLVTPADLATIYNLAPLFKLGLHGKGQTIAVIEDSDVFSTADWSAFRKTFGLSPYLTASFRQVHPAPKTGANNCGAPGVVSLNNMEAILDAEYASASAPGAAIQLVACKDTTTTFGGQIALQNLLNASATPPSVVSLSYGDCEPDMGAAFNAAFKNLYQQASTEGVSVFVSSGDEAAAGCDASSPMPTEATHGIAVNGLASTAFNVAVGGTDFEDTYQKDSQTYWNPTNTATYGSAKSYIPEIPWNESCGSAVLAKYLGYATTYGSGGFCNSSMGQSYHTVIGGSGGPSNCSKGAPSTALTASGTCTGWLKPSWQVVLGNPADKVRDLPDVSLFASSGVWGHFLVFCFSNQGDGGAPCTGTPDNWSGAGGTSFSAP